MIFHVPADGLGAALCLFLLAAIAAAASAELPSPQSEIALGLVLGAIVGWTAFNLAR